MHVAIYSAQTIDVRQLVLSYMTTYVIVQECSLLLRFQMQPLQVHALIRFTLWPCYYHHTIIVHFSVIKNKVIIL